MLPSPTAAGGRLTSARSNGSPRPGERSAPCPSARWSAGRPRAQPPSCPTASTRSSGSSPDPPPEWFTELPGLRLLYVGSLDDRIDTAQVGALADARPDASIVLVGALLDPGHYEDCAALPNVRLVERRARREIVALVCAADACLIPHVRNPMTEAMSPLKLYEYLAGGAPIAAADLPGIAGVDPTVELVEPGADMAPAVERALARGRARESVRRRAIQAHSWTGRIDDILELALREGPA